MPIIAHPTYPLAAAERAESIMCHHDPEELEEIARRYAARRNAEFPQWATKYEREVREWLVAQLRFRTRA